MVVIMMVMMRDVLNYRKNVQVMKYAKAVTNKVKKITGTS